MDGENPQREMAEAPGALMAQLLAETAATPQAPARGAAVEGTVMAIGADEVLVDIGGKAEGVVPSRDLANLPEAERAALVPGAPVLAIVVQAETADGHPVLSIARAREERSWRRLAALAESGETIEATVTGANKGGLLVDLDGARGFIPASQVTELRAGGDEAARQSQLERLIGRTLPLAFVEVNRERNRLVLSERQATQARREASRGRLLEELVPGERRRGRVTGLAPFGAFVDIGGADGLIHLSELAWERVAQPSEVLRVGDEVEVVVLGVDRERGKISLSRKRALGDPWATVGERYTPNQLVRGTLTRLAAFGAFAWLEAGIEGLIHNDELVDGMGDGVRELLRVGDALPLRVVRVEPERRRIGLSLRGVLDDSEARAEVEGLLTERRGGSVREQEADEDDMPEEAAEAPEAEDTASDDEA